MDIPLPDDWRPVWEAACAARGRAYAPYSRFTVGAALRLRHHPEPIGGCNVENASYGSTLCAERNAVFRAVAQAGARPGDFAYLVLVTGTDKPTVPCANCLQVLAEFCPPDFPLILSNLRGDADAVPLGALLPRPFNHFSLDAHV